jgi:hypothetical protein
LQSIAKLAHRRDQVWHLVHRLYRVSGFLVFSSSKMDWTSGAPFPTVFPDEAFPGLVGQQSGKPGSAQPKTNLYSVLKRSPIPSHPPPAAFELSLSNGWGRSVQLDCQLSFRQFLHRHSGEVARFRQLFKSGCRQMRGTCNRQRRPPYDVRLNQRHRLEVLAIHDWVAIPIRGAGIGRDLE